MAKVATSIDWQAVRKTRHLKKKMKPPKISKAVKYGLAFFNGVFWLLSLLLIAGGYWSITSSDTAAIKTTSVFALVLNISVLLLLIGVVMFAVSLSGILGTLRENLPLLGFYRACILVFLFLEFGLILFCAAFSGYIYRVVSRDLPQQTVATYRDDFNMQNLLDFLQQTFHCCGVSVSGYLDWSANVYFNCTDSNPSIERCGVPWSCCLDPDKTPVRDTMCGQGMQKLTAVEANEHIHTDGCISAVARKMQQHTHVVGAASVAVAFAQGAAMYQATRICILLERMAPKKRQNVKQDSLFSVARLVMLVGLFTGAQQPVGVPDEEEGGGKRKRRDDEDEGEKRKKKKRKKEEGEKRKRDKGDAGAKNDQVIESDAGDSSSSSDYDG